MATTYKILGQATNDGQGASTVYTVPAGTQAVISTITITNISANSGTPVDDGISLSVVKSGETITTKSLLLSNSTVAAKDMKALTLGLTLSAGDKIYATASNVSGQTNLAIQVFGSEIA